MNTSNSGFVLLDYKDTEEYRVARRVLERFEQMTDKEKFQSLVDAGIFDENGELTERYGGKVKSDVS
jgi:hypothetical protein